MLAMAIRMLRSVTDLRVAVRVAIQRRSAPYTKDRTSVALIQPEPIRTAAPRAANAVDRTARKYSNVPTQPPAATRPGYYDHQRGIRRQIAHHVGKLGSLGFEVTLCRIPEAEPDAIGPAQAT